MNTLYQLNQVVIHLMQLVVLTQKHVIPKEKYRWIEMFEMNDIIIKKAQDKQKVKQPFVECSEKHYPTFEFLYLHIYYLWYICIW
jgi:hypothetical protein